MKIIEDEKIKGEVMSGLSEEFKRERWHVTDGIYCPRKVFFRRIGVKEPFREEFTLIRLFGKALHILLEVYKYKEVRVEKDGIIGTIDMIRDKPVEIYTTRKSLKNEKEVEKAFSYKIKQLGAYCYMTNSSYGYLVVLYIAGDYKPPFPILKVYRIYFEEEELEKIWNEINRRIKLIAVSIKDRSVPEEKGESWECEYCPYKSLCESADNIFELRKRIKKYLEVVSLFEDKV